MSPEEFAQRQQKQQQWEQDRAAARDAQAAEQARLLAARKNPHHTMPGPRRLSQQSSLRKLSRSRQIAQQQRRQSLQPSRHVTST